MIDEGGASWTTYPFGGVRVWCDLQQRAAKLSTVNSEHQHHNVSGVGAESLEEVIIIMISHNIYLIDTGVPALLCHFWKQ